jgi:hypothetical protein
MFDSATLNLFIAITIFVVVTVAGRDLLARFGMSKALAQGISGLAGIGVAVGFLLAIG